MKLDNRVLNVLTSTIKFMLENIKEANIFESKSVSETTIRGVLIKYLRLIRKYDHAFTYENLFELDNEVKVRDICVEVFLNIYYMDDYTDNAVLDFKLYTYTGNIHIIYKYRNSIMINLKRGRTLNKEHANNLFDTEFKYIRDDLLVNSTISYFETYYSMVDQTMKDNICK